MFHDFKWPPDEDAWIAKEKADKEFSEKFTKPLPPGEWKRIERPIYSGFWRGIHNMFAHPLLTIHRPSGEWLHAYTAERMYREIPGVDPVVTDND